MSETVRVTGKQMDQSLFRKPMVTSRKGFWKLESAKVFKRLESEVKQTCTWTGGDLHEGGRWQGMQSSTECMINQLPCFSLSDDLVAAWMMA